MPRCYAKSGPGGRPLGRRPRRSRPRRRRPALHRSRTFVSSGQAVAHQGGGSMTKMLRVRAGRAALFGAVGLALLVATSAGFGSSAGGAAPRSAAPVSLKVMVFNIENGGTQVSFAKVAQAIKKSGADVAGIEEACGHMPRLARLVGWPYYDRRLQIVSRYPLVDPPGGNGVYTFVQLAPGQWWPWRTCTCHQRPTAQLGPQRQDAGTGAGHGAPGAPARHPGPARGASRPCRPGHPRVPHRRLQRPVVARLDQGLRGHTQVPEVLGQVAGERGGGGRRLPRLLPRHLPRTR